jgi:hypothetical protein
MTAPKKTEITRLKWGGDAEWFELELWNKSFAHFKTRDSVYGEIITIRDLDFFLELHKAMTAAITEMERIHNLNK